MVRKQKKKVKMQMLFGGETEVSLTNRFGAKKDKNKYRTTSCADYKTMSYDDPIKTEIAHAKCEKCRINNSESSKMCHAKKNPPKPKLSFPQHIKQQVEEKERTQRQPNPRFER